MKKLLLLVSVFSLLVSCMQAERNCTDFKTGKFKFEHEVDGVIKTTFFERNDSIEIETYEGKTDTASIRWVNDCEYVLTKLNPKSMAEEKAVNIKILSTKDNSYLFEFGIVGMAQKQRGTATKLN
ncbi:DNA topoisomerase IV [Flavobacterium sp. NG2]|uniref:DNA topoisomerase IV n=1 Tax=Flavobacterium sp. NG2 TaxID=3097547 RepID=UPI002A7FFEF2|nr:DNA topoisomerase IV [Flavobacterium sp. NG2]WPR70965.1 DNA topoisomerase IV [Flavobacterium sp. NG2]